MGARPEPEERIVQAGKIVTAAGVSAGIDLALWLAGQIVGQERAEAIQLVIEYDPRPPFDAGHSGKASDRVRKLAKEMTGSADAYRPAPSQRKNRVAAHGRPRPHRKVRRGASEPRRSNR